MSGLRVVKAHAYGNDFLLVPEAEVRLKQDAASVAALSRALCDRHRGIGGDGLILYAVRDHGATMSIHNADGSGAELSGNGVRCLAAVVARGQQLRAGAEIGVDTDAGVKRLELLARDAEQYTFRADLGQPENIRQISIAVGGEALTATALSMGNPHCVLLGPLPHPERFSRLGPAIAAHPMFPAGTNVEFAQVEAPGLVRIVIWERGVGPTTSSGTGTCAAAVAAAAHGGSARQMQVLAPGGAQQVEWRTDGVYLTGWAEIVLEGKWVRGQPVET